MGIKDLNKLLKEACGGEYARDVPMSEFAYRRVAIDAPLYLHKMAYTHDKKRMVDAYVEMIVKLREKKIHPVFVFDGESPPEKKAAQQKRSDERKRQEERVENLERDLAIDGPPSQLLMETYAKRVKQAGLLVEIEYDRDEMVEYVEKLRSRIVKIDESDYDLMRETLDAMNVTRLTAPNEAEMLCASLCKHGDVAGVMTTDTDVLAAGCPVVLTDMKRDHFTCIYFEELLAKIQMTAEQFTDLCIMCGTDFNPNVPRIGWKKSLDLIRKHKRIENVPIDGKQVLNHVRVRQLFEPEKYTEKIPYCRPISYGALESWLVSKEAWTDVDRIRARVG